MAIPPWRVAEDKELLAWYNKYLKSRKWEKKRKEVRARSGGLCEVCHVKKAVECHHDSYDHVGDELMDELRDVCRSCHRKIHEREDWKK